MDIRNILQLQLQDARQSGEIPEFVGGTTGFIGRLETTALVQ